MKTKEAAIIINNQSIPWSFIQRVRRICGGDWDQTLDIFWKCRNATGTNGIIRYITRGLLDLGKNNKWLFLPSKERECGRMESIRQWWSSLYERKPREGTASCKEALKEALQALMASM